MHQCHINGIAIGGKAPVRVMGVMNVSPESFYAGSYYPGTDILDVALQMIENGADIVDVGARSTAPGAPAIGIGEERDRMERALSILDGSGITISVDTIHPEVLESCLRHDIHAVNDISGLAISALAAAIADSGLPAFLMASDNDPGDALDLEGTWHAMNMLIERCNNRGITEYVLDPAIGLWTPGRTVDLDWEICRHFHEFQTLRRPLLAAISRKTFIGDVTGKPPENRLAGSLALTVMLLSHGADIVRCHDVAETADAIHIFEQMEQTS